MQDLLTFLLAHWALSAGFVVFLVMIIVVEMLDFQGGSAGVDPAQLVTMMNREKALVLDVRPKEAYDNAHILGAEHVPLEHLNDQKQWPAALKKAAKKPVVVVCAAGVSAKKAAEMLKKQDYAMVSVLQGGMNAWTQSSLPVVQ